MYHVLPNNTAYSANSIRCTDIQHIYTAYSNQLNTAYRSPDTVAELNLISMLNFLYSSQRAFPTDLFSSVLESNSTKFDLFSDIEELLEEEAIEIMTEIMKQYMSKTRGDYGSGVTRLKIDENAHFKLKGKFLKELHDNTFSGSEHEDANEHIEKVLEIVDLFHILNITQDQIMLRAFPVSLPGAASRWLTNEPAGSILTWEVLKLKFLSKYYLLARTAKKMEDINNF
ncbi:hypothetical protein Tco_1508243 [Tanacetum coccineum]